MDYLKNKQLFSTIIWERGFGYFQDSLVKITKDSGEEVTAVVKGTHDYKVSMEFLPDGLMSGATCTCPYADVGYCKHVAAVIFALNEKNFKLPDENKPIAGNQYQTLLGDISRAIDNPDRFLSLAMSLYEKNYQNWDEAARSSGFIGLFIEAFEAYRADHLGDVFLSFIDRVHLSKRSEKMVFEHFYKEVRYEPWIGTFVAKAIQNPKFTDLCNSILTTKQYEYSYYPFIDAVYDAPAQMVPYLTDATLIKILSATYRNDRNPAAVIDVLIEEKREDVLKELISPSSRAYLREDNERKVRNHFVEQAYQKRDRDALEKIINTHDASFKAVYCYYQLLEEADRKRLKPQLKSLCSSLWYMKQFSIMIGESTKLSDLTGMSLEDLTLLHQEIQRLYSGRYLRQLTIAMNRALSPRSGQTLNLIEVYRMLDCYLDDAPSLALEEKLQRTSFYTAESRLRYLRLLKKHQILLKAGIHEYPQANVQQPEEA